MSRIHPNLHIRIMDTRGRAYMKEQQKLSGSPKHPDTAATIFQKSQPLVSEVSAATHAWLVGGTNTAILLARDGHGVLNKCSCLPDLETQARVQSCCTCILPAAGCRPLLPASAQHVVKPDVYAKRLEWFTLFNRRRQESNVFPNMESRRSC